MSLFGERSSHDMGKTKGIHSMDRSPRFVLKRPKVYSTREFPLHCGPSAIDPKGKCPVAGPGPSVKSDQSKLVPRRVNNELVRPLGSQNRACDVKKVVVSPEIEWRKENRRSENRVLVGASGSGNSHVSEETRLVTHDVVNEVARAKVKDALKVYEKLYKEISNEYNGVRKAEYNGGRRICIETAEKMRKMGKWDCDKKKIGHIEGISIGDRFLLRAELFVIGLHCQYTAGIDYLSKNGKIFAISIVESGNYENEAKSVDVLIYSGQGGNPLLGTSKVDQELKRGNLALKNSMEMGYPIRVIYKSKKADSMHMSKGVLVHSYTYNGLYVVKKIWKERDQDGRMVFKFELHKIQGQPAISSQFCRESKKTELCLVEDISQGKEKMSIRVMNGIDNEKPQQFTYITETIYPNSPLKSELAGCTCTNGCSSMEQCLCVSKNADDISYGCGPFCNCPPSCKIRVTQQGPKYKLEIYKTKFGRWAVRSKNFIQSGSFVCECVGMLVPSKKDQHQEGEFEVGFVMDTVKFGNVGRFIGHSDSPNLVARYSLYDHDDKRMAHIMLYAAKGIPPTKELTCDHNLVKVEFANN